MIVRVSGGKISWDGPPNTNGADGYGVTSSAPCALGRSGVVPEADKREGDGATPAGTYVFRSVLYQPEREAAPVSGLPVSAIARDDGWCDDPAHPDTYNRPVKLPHAGSREEMWREDGLYDIVLVIGHNDDPPVPGRGSAIFVHCALPAEDGGLRTTAGCVALPKADLRALAAALKPGDVIEISGA